MQLGPFAAKMLIADGLDCCFRLPRLWAQVRAHTARLGNYAPLARFHHRIKTFRAWALRQPLPGVWIWRDPHGHHFVVDHTAPARSAAPAPTPLPARPPVHPPVRPPSAHRAPSARQS